MMSSTPSGVGSGSRPQHSRWMWMGGVVVAALTGATLWLVFRNVSAVSLSTGLSWLVVIGGVGLGVFLWRWTNAKRASSAYREELEAGFLLAGPVRRGNAAKRAVKWLVVKKERDGLVGLAILCGILVSIASFYTTFMGSMTFFGYKPFQIVFALLLALGIQGALYVASWLVAEEAASHARARANNFGRRQWFAIKHGNKVAITLLCMVLSVFFSFASHFENVYGEERLLLANVQNARSDTTKVLVDAEKAIIDERNAVSAKLKSSPEWATFNNGLEQLLRFIERQPDLIRKALNDRRSTAEGELAKVRAEIEARGKALAEVNGRIEAIRALGAAPATAQAIDNASLEKLRKEREAARERKLMFERAAEIEFSAGNDPERVPAECQAIAREQVTNRGAAAASAKNAKNAKQQKTAPSPAPGRTKAASGPVHRCLTDNAKEADINFRKFDSEIKRAEKEREGQLTASASRDKDIGSYEAERVRLTGEKAVLESREAALKKDYQVIDGGAAGLLSGSDNTDLVRTVRSDRDEFLRAGHRAIFDRLIQSCGTLSQALQTQQRSAKDAAAAQPASAQQCDSSGLLAPIDRLTTLSVALEQYRGACVVNQEFNNYGNPAKYVSKGSECLALAKVPERTIEESYALDRIAQLNHPATAPFERAVASLRRGDVLAWLSMGLAIAVDVLVLLCSLLGARANSTVLERRGKIESTEDRKDVLAEDTDIHIYGDEPKKVLRAKLFLSAVNYRMLDPEEPAVPVVDLQRVPARHRTNVRNFLNSVASAGLAHALRGFDHLYRIDPDLQLHQGRLVGEFERVRTIEHGARPMSEDEDFSGVGEGPSDHLTGAFDPATGAAASGARQASPGAIGDHPVPPGAGTKRPEQTTPGPTKRYGGGWPS